MSNIICFFLSDKILNKTPITTTIMDKTDITNSTTHFNAFNTSNPWPSTLLARVLCAHEKLKSTYNIVGR